VNVTSDIDSTKSLISADDQTSLSYFVIGTLLGDANGDLMVNVSDLSILAANYGMTSGATWLTGDFTGDGLVNVSDLSILAANYGGSSAELASFLSTPEPMTMTLLTIGGLAMLRRRK
jgi:hypothetical protein